MTKGKKVESCASCKFASIPEGDKVKRGTCRRYPVHTPIATKSWCGEHTSK